MLTGSSATCATLLLTSFCLLTVVHSQGGSVRLLFVDSDLRVMESATNVTTFVRVEGDATENLTVTVIPLTVSQYQADPSRYRNSCDSSITSSASIDPAEASDFSGQQLDRQIPNNAIGPGQSYEFNVNIGLMDDNIREPEEYFLLFLNATQSPPVDTIMYDSGRDCARISIEDQDFFSISFVPLINPVVVSEDEGTIEIIRIEKQGSTEKLVDVTFSGADSELFTISPDALTLQPNETSALISITMVDNQFAEYDNTSVTISADSPFGSDSILITIRDDDGVVVGFDQTEVTVIEGETVTLTASFSNTDITFLRIPHFFEVFTQQGMGNATENHYTSLSDEEYVVGNLIEIQTKNDSKLERPRQFEVKLAYSVSTPLVVVQPDTVIVTIKDRNGEPNKPDVVNVRKEKDDLTVTWTIDKHELRPVDVYVITIRVNGSRTQDSSINTTVDAKNANCKLNGNKYHCIHVIEREINDGKMYNVTVCAKSDFGQNCSDPTVVLPKPAPLQTDGRSILGIVFGVIVAVLACCLLWMLIALIVCCTCCEREKKYNPEKKEKENEKLRNKDMYTKVDLSESPTNEYDFV